MHANSRQPPRNAPAAKSKGIAGRSAAVFAAAMATAATSPCAAPSQPPVRDAARHEIATIRDGPALPQGRACHAAALLEGRVVVAGGSAWSADRMTKNWFADTLVIDPDGQSWTRDRHCQTPSPR